MKLARYTGPTGEARFGAVEDGAIYDVGASPFEPRRGGKVAERADVRLLAPLAGPRKIVCVGLNYQDHAEEAGLAIPENPVLFAKFENSIVGPGDAIAIPSFAKEVDFEAELGVVIGKRASVVDSQDALEYVLGYTCVNDVSAREIQFSDGQWIRGKTLDTFCPLGPWIVTTDEVPDPQALGIRCVVNGVVMQNSSTAQMARSVAELVSFISQGITLEPGDVIATGTPAGVGFTRKPPVFLQPGDVVRVEIDGIGVLENPVVSRP